MTAYSCYKVLSENEVQGVDYSVVINNRSSPVLIIAPHGGEIEPGTTEVAKEVAGPNYGFYSFMGIKEYGNRKLHITSTQFDEPILMKYIGNYENVIAFHGCLGGKPEIFIGGLDQYLKKSIYEDLKEAGFMVTESEKFPGKNPRNVCNLSRDRKGCQLELSSGLRKLMFRGLASNERHNKTDVFYSFTKAVKKGIKLGCF